MCLCRHGNPEDRISHPKARLICVETRIGIFEFLSDIFISLCNSLIQNSLLTRCDHKEIM